MSVKIYGGAYRIKPHVAKDLRKFWQWVRDTQRQGEVNVKKVMTNTYKGMIAAVEPDNETYRKLVDQHQYSDYSARLSTTQRAFYEGLKKNAAMSERNMFDFDVTVVIRELDGNLYVKNHCDMLCRDVLNFMSRDKRLEDFTYWNSTDPPAWARNGAGYRRWKKRGETWLKLDEHITEHLIITISDLSKFLHLDPWLDLARAHSKAKKRAAKQAKETEHADGE